MNLKRTSRACKSGIERAVAGAALSALVLVGIAPVPALAASVAATSPSTPPSAPAATASPDPTAAAPATEPTTGPTATSTTAPATTAPATSETAPAATEGTTPAPVTSSATPAATAPSSQSGIQADIPAPGTYTPFGAIGAKWTQLGGAVGPLGEPTSNEACDAAGLCVETFTSGNIYYTPTTGAHPVLFGSGKTGPQWNESGALPANGYPVTDENCDASGCFQSFSGGMDITWTSAGGFVRTHGAIGGAVFRLYGGYAGTGYPTTPEVCDLPANGCAQEFGSLRIMWSAASGAYGVWGPGAIGARYAANGSEAGRLGFPLSKEICGLKAGGCYQLYQGGAIIWSAGTGARVSLGAIRSEWASRGFENGGLGYPVSEEQCDLPGSGCQQLYQGGAIYWSSKTGAHATNGAIKGRFDGQGGVGGYLAYPLEDEVCGQPNGGCYQWFQGGLIFWSPLTGAQPIRGGMKSKYESMGWHLSYLGYPAMPETCVGGECVQAFQGGYLTWTSAASNDYRHTECTTLNDGRVKYTTGDAKRVTLTIAADYGQSYATVAYCKRVAGTYVTDWRTDGRVGASGFKPPGVPSGPTRYNYSPTGSFSVTEAFGLGNPGTALPYRTLNPNSRWGGNPWTDTYNKYFESTSWVGYDENMWYFATGGSHDYRQGAVINYNRPPDSEIVQDAGFAIFLHEHKVPTAGCISLDDWAVEDFLRKSTPGDRIIMGVARDIFR
ncbi:hypothetical protein [Arthrobacter sp. 92]|uniref:hypothetical protein n=1 Tax=Arthrobacter sp. 92 TaxID=3418175 RepID=UPI003D02F84D